MCEYINDNDALWNEAYEWAYQRANEEGDVDLDYDDEPSGEKISRISSFGSFLGSIHVLLS